MTRTVICGIYKITSPSGRVYIGQSIDIFKRWDWYKKCLSRKYKNCQTQLYRSFKKYGVSGHLFEILCRCSKEELHEQEINFIAKYQANNRRFGLNCTLGGDGVRGLVFSEASKKKMRKAATGNKNMLGKVHSDEAKKKMSARKLGTKMSDETKAKISIATKQRLKRLKDNGELILSPETRAKIKESLTGRTFSEDHKESIKQSWAKRKDSGNGHRSPESNKKTRDSIILHWVKRRENGMDKKSEESKRKTSESLRKTWEKRKEMSA